MAEPRVTKCRSCSAQVIFVKNASSKKTQILDAKPVTFWTLEPDLMGEQLAHGRKGHVDHHATCPSAEQWRKKK